MIARPSSRDQLPDCSLVMAIREVGRHLLDALGAHLRRFLAQVAVEDDDIALAAQRLGDPFHLEDAGVDGVGTHKGHAFRQVGRLAVDIDQRDARIDRRLGHRIGGVGVGRDQHDGVHALGDEVLDLAQLHGHIFLGIYKGHFHAILGGAVGLHRLAHGGQPAVVEQHADADA
jgi:choline dehydrogenase-like flavoprotein